MSMRCRHSRSQCCSEVFSLVQWIPHELSLLSFHTLWQSQLFPGLRHCRPWVPVQWSGVWNLKLPALMPWSRVALWRSLMGKECMPPVLSWVPSNWRPPRTTHYIDLKFLPPLNPTNRCRLPPNSEKTQLSLLPTTMRSRLFSAFSILFLLRCCDAVHSMGMICMQYPSPTCQVVFHWTSHRGITGIYQPYFALHHRFIIINEVVISNYFEEMPNVFFVYCSIWKMSSWRCNLVLK